MGRGVAAGAPKEGVPRAGARGQLGQRRRRRATTPTAVATIPTAVGAQNPNIHFTVVDWARAIAAAVSPRGIRTPPAGSNLRNPPMRPYSDNAHQPGAVLGRQPDRADQVIEDEQRVWEPDDSPIGLCGREGRAGE